jgi:hypothetical protein
VGPHPNAQTPNQSRDRKEAPSRDVAERSGANAHDLADVAGALLRADLYDAVVAARNIGQLSGLRG